MIEISRRDAIGGSSFTRPVAAAHAEVEFKA